MKPLVALWRKPAARRTVGIGMCAMAGLGLGVAWGSWTRACAGQACPSIAEFDEYRPVQSVKFYAADGRLIEDLGQSRTVLPLKEMSTAVPAAFLAVEDKRFYEHKGIDWVRFVGAARSNVLALGWAEGFSGITMQLARNIFRDRLPSEKRLSRKLREVQVAVEIERTYPKARILELYLNQIYLGRGAHGVENAAQRYFGKSARDLNVAEAALLAAVTQRPGNYDPRIHPEAAVRRRNLVINLMRNEGYLTPEQADYWKAYPVILSSRDDFRGVAEYFVEWVRQQVYARFGNRLYSEGYHVYTTIDLDMQIAAEQAMEDQLRAIENGEVRPNYPHVTYQAYLDSIDGAPPKLMDTPYLQGALVTLDTNGYVRAMVGGRSFRESEYNRAVQALRQPGSTFKPFVYAAAIRAGRPASHIIDDAPISVMTNDTMPWEPRNYEGDFRGPMTLRKGLRQSRNLVAIRLGQELGISTVVGEAVAFGISTPIPNAPSTFIGSASVHPMEMVSAYTTFATLGVRAAPVAILRVEDAAGNIVWEPQVRKTRIMDTEHAWILTSMLRDVVDRGTGIRVRNPGGFPYAIPTGGKTGTTNDGADVWFMGFTPELVTGIWIGFDQPKKIMPNSAGGLLAAPAWASYMKEVYERREVPEEWQRPESLIPVQVDNVTGMRATQFCPPAERYFEWFVPGTEPQEYCRVHRGFRFGISSLPDRSTGHRHGPQ